MSRADLKSLPPVPRTIQLLGGTTKAAEFFGLKSLTSIRKMLLNNEIPHKHVMEAWEEVHPLDPSITPHQLNTDFPPDYPCDCQKQVVGGN